ncbi:methylenetetrahydrofolate--tRNA-(uracil(54)-C(5))-methyltransferase (FADH(2)-oxidizing) TrmFO [Clostridium sp. 'deep sea']|uniref:methylenetetrahydrofolate--tRNA-(uracil(54)- C(5))-methyltransferase (FADH(2)-oxidizing) TrmFO n=1 Tax=Clostridium sp. 'deep sea' TaxID=2779445 RepID=UPI0018963F48|nr:methylenetetrahydrofolate--tRNA-(uracil(54)-C(5))-methyltransferase (FADH(2)-oxidizing) TrmFO [Clostridium sp. 'deep sea']QOR36036.1 methylenetetrahydrofolate--tRNA-(uracil(54)-C(5))-methyltransferase (FADH(2)-oxidizing) TrmFO [Clostridium sp. 'deep sea']
MNKLVHVIGAGLAGSEAAWQLASRGIAVNLYEMRPQKNTPAHKTADFAELVCSNSLRAKGLSNAVGLLKEELRLQNSLIMEAADKFSLPAGGALAVDRKGFAKYITNKIKEHDLITVINQEIKHINTDELCIVAAGPLCSDDLAEDISKLIKEEHLHFFDAAAPIVNKESINFNVAFWGSRYDKGGKDYINCPMNKDQYEEFYKELINAEVQPLHEFEDKSYFEGCMPVEVMASRGEQTLLFGPLKPVGLTDLNGEQPHAVVQLRQDNIEGTLYNMVGFQTRLKWPEQKRVFRKIPGLESAEFERLGVMHRNTFVNSPKTLLPTGQLKHYKNVLIAGQLSGVEGYVESTASGLICGINAAKIAMGNEPIIWPAETAHGSLMNYITTAPTKGFQPMNITFGIIPPLGRKVRKRRERKEAVSSRALEILKEFLE